MTVLRELRVVDSHTEGNPTRVVVGGLDPIPGSSVAEQYRWLRDHDDGLRGLLNFEPRGNPMMCSVLLVPAFNRAADFGAVIVEQDEYVPMCGHCIIGAATTVVAEGLVPRVPVTPVVFETVAGLVRCEVECTGDRIGPVRLANVDSFLLHADAHLDLAGLGQVHADIAFGGDFYAIVDADAIGAQVHPGNERELGDLAGRILAAVGEQLTITHPERPDIDRCYEVLFTTRSGDGMYRHAVISPPGVFDRSPCGTGTSARLATLVTRGEIEVGQRHWFSGVTGTRFAAVATAAQTRDGLLMIRPVIEGNAYITAYSRIVLDDRDPFPTGLRIGRRGGLDAPPISQEAAR